MTQQEPCDKCGQKTICREAFRRLGNIEGKPIVRSIFTAFMLPLAVFIVVLAVAQQFLAQYLTSAGLRTMFALFLAFAVAAACVTIFKMTGNWLGRRKCRDKI